MNRSLWRSDERGSVTVIVALSMTAIIALLALGIDLGGLFNARSEAQRAADAPDNFLHLLRLVEAERATATGDFQTAAVTFDAARRLASDVQRPWHRALICERAARFKLAHGMQLSGAELLAAARRAYRDWGATAKVSQLDWAHPTVADLHRVRARDVQPPSESTQHRASVTSGAIDMLGILAASKALSSRLRCVSIAPFGNPVVPDVY